MIWGRILSLDDIIPSIIGTYKGNPQPHKQGSIKLEVVYDF